MIGQLRRSSNSRSSTPSVDQSGRYHQHDGSVPEPITRLESRMPTKDRSRSRSPVGKLVLGLVGIGAVVGAIVGGIALTSFSRTDGGTTMVIRNGGPFDSQDVRQVLPPASPRTYSGMFSDEHPYPAQQRFYDI